jgi:hypothetical protein
MQLLRAQVRRLRLLRDHRRSSAWNIGWPNIERADEISTAATAAMAANKDPNGHCGATLLASLLAEIAEG